MNKEVLQQSLAVGSARSMPAARDEEEIEFFVRLD
jgi:hypothetical protein